jgi:hypothetical protein
LVKVWRDKFLQSAQFPNSTGNKAGIDIGVVIRRFGAIAVIVYTRRGKLETLSNSPVLPKILCSALKEE